MTGKIERSPTGRHIIGVLGGRQETQRITGLPRSVIDGWWRGGWVHGKHHALILVKGRAAGKPITYLDFVRHLWGIPLLDGSERQAA